MLAGSYAANEVSTAGNRRDHSSYAIPLRSHYADFQFMHGMAPFGQQAKKTRAVIGGWAELMYLVADGSITAKNRIQDVAINRPNLKILGPYLGGQTIGRFLDYKEDEPEFTKAIAFGALIHMIQDSYAKCHTNRDSENRIVQFLTFDGQSPTDHSLGDDPTVYESELGAHRARVATKQLVDAFKSKTSYENVRPIIERHFLLSSETVAAGPGPCAV